MYKIILAIAIFSHFSFADHRICANLLSFYDHRVQGAEKVLPIFPGAGYISATLGILQNKYPGKAIVLTKGRISKPMVLPDGFSNYYLDISHSEEGKILITTPQVSEKESHFSAIASTADLPLQIDSIPDIPEMVTGKNIKQIYQDLRSVGLKYGPYYQGLKFARVVGTEAYGLVIVQEDLRNDGYPIHPAILDSSFHLIAAAIKDSSPKIYVPALFKKLEYYGNPTKMMFAKIVVDKLPTPESAMFQSHVTLWNSHGHKVIEITDFRFANVDFKN